MQNYVNFIIPGFELSKNKWGVDICLFIVIAITHRRFSIINNGGGVETDPPRVSQGIMFGGLGKQLGGFNPPTPPAIQTLHHPEEVIELKRITSFEWGQGFLRRINYSSVDKPTSYELTCGPVWQ
jgi:hypothetical protein